MRYTFSDMGQMISYKRPDGKTVPGYLAEPKMAPGARGMVVIHGQGLRWEWQLLGLKEGTR